MDLKTYSRARSAKAAMAKILEMHDLDALVANIQPFEVNPGHFAAGMTVPAGVAVDELALADLAGFQVLVPLDDDTALDTIKKDGINGRCPFCGIDHIANGYCEYDEIDFPDMTRQFECLGCGREWGPKIDKTPAPAVKKPVAKEKVAHIRETSVVERPTKLVWAIAMAMPDATRKEVIAECRRRGIAHGTARTQYQLWKAASKA